jgi:hypothetical protein
LKSTSTTSTLPEFLLYDPLRRMEGRIESPELMTVEFSSFLVVGTGW